jgi:hypothetical protein
MCARCQTTDGLTLDTTQDAFRDAPTNATAADYLDMLTTYAADDMIGDDTFFNGLHEIYEYLAGPSK